MSLPRVFVVLALVLLGQGGVARAQSSEPTLAPVNGEESIVAGVVRNAVSTMKLCDLTNEKSRDPQVRFLCKQASLDDAHIAITGMQLGEQLGAKAMSLQPLPETADELESLAQYSGRDFDRAFLLLHIERAETSRKTLRYALEVSTNPAVKRYENFVLLRVQRQIDLAVSALRSVDRL